jgi:hypothetical protein
MKRGALVVALFIALIAAPLFAQDNHQKIYPIDSDVYQAIKALYIARGLALPSTTGPWSEDELLLMLERLDDHRFKNGEQSLYDYAAAELAPQKVAFKFTGIVATEMYAHTNTEDFTALEDYIRPYNLTKPLFEAQFEVRLTPYGYGFGEFSIGNNVVNDWVTKNDGRQRAASTFFGKTAVASNIFMLPPGVLTDIDLNFPTRAFVSLGGHGFNFQIGRERLSWGAGESGNLIVGDHIKYHNVVRTTFYGDALKYTFNVSGFPNPDEYYTTDESTKISTVEGQGDNETGFDKGVNLFIAHRLEWRILKNKVGFALTEGIMYQNSTGYVDLSVLLPTVLMHNAYRPANMNSILGFEVDYSPIPALNIYGQMAVDEFPMPGEGVPGVDDNAIPNGFGFILGAQTSLPLAGRMFSASLEAAWTDPYLYLRRSGDWGSSDYQLRGLNYIVANRYYSQTGGKTIYAEDALGYRWGNDAVVINAHAGYRDLGAWNVEANLMFMVHGTFDPWTMWSTINATEDSTAWPNGKPGNQTSPTDHHYQGNYADGTTSDRNASYVLTALSLLGSWNIGTLPSLNHLPALRHLALYGQIDLVIVANPLNNKNADTIADLQFTLGASYTF